MISQNATAAWVIDIDELRISRPGLGEPYKWYLTIQSREQRYVMNLMETHTYQDDHITIHYATGDVSVFDEAQQGTGTARILFDVTNPASIRAQGNFKVDSRVFHLESQPSVHLREEAPMFDSTPRVFLDSTEPSHLLGYKRAEDSDNSGSATSWPSTSELESALKNNVASQCFRTRLSAQIGVAADSNFLSSFSSVRDARVYIANTVNKASEVWEQAFNISLILSEVLTASDTGTKYAWDLPCNQSVDSVNSLDTRLQAITQWRKQERANDGLALWSLWTDCPSGDVIGLAWQSTACEPGAANVVHHSILDYRVFAHETAHVFGAIHDCTNTTCGTSTPCCPLSVGACDAHGSYIMNPGTDQEQFIFSQCTRNNVCDSIVHGLTNMSCLAPQGTQFDFVRSKKCEFSNDPAIYEECLRNLQCVDYTNSTSSYFCGNIDDCTLKCYEPEARQCLAQNVPLLDRTPCRYPGKKRALCYAGKCRTEHMGLKFVWIAVGFSIFTGICILGSASYLLARAISAYRSEDAHQAPVSSLSLKSSLGRESVSTTTGFPPILKYSSSMPEDPVDLPTNCQ